MPPEAGGGDALARALRRDRLILLAGMAAIFGLAAVYTVMGVGMEMSALEMTALSGEGGRTSDPAGTMAAMGAMAMAAPEWTPVYALLVFLMWWVMMTAMMLPAASPMILLHAALLRHGRPTHSTAGRSTAFLCGYLTVWGGFSAIAAALQWLGERGGWLAPETMRIGSGALAAAVLLAAGVYQLTPAKERCLEHCRSPAAFFTRHYLPGRLGAFRLGLVHGGWCFGCCWALMALLFVGGIMNLWWIAGLALVVLTEKLLPFGNRLGQLLGLAAIVGGAVLLARALALF